MIVFGEPSVIYNYSEIFSLGFWAPMSAAGLFGFAIGYVTGLQVKVRKTSSLSLHY
jgi:GDP-fucose transporter C1